jgi:hypothetical protein
MSDRRRPLPDAADAASILSGLDPGDLPADLARLRLPDILRMLQTPEGLEALVAASRGPRGRAPDKRPRPRPQRSASSDEQAPPRRRQRVPESSEGQDDDGPSEVFEDDDSDDETDAASYESEDATEAESDADSSADSSADGSAESDADGSADSSADGSSESDADGSADSDVLPQVSPPRPQGVFDDGTEEEAEDVASSDGDGDIAVVVVPAVIDVTPAMRARVLELAAMSVSAYRVRRAFSAHVNFDVESLLPSIAQPGARLMVAPPQSYKTAGIAAQLIIGAVMERPSVVVVADKRCNVMGIAGKLMMVMPRTPLFSVTATYMPGRRAWSALAASSDMERFRNGRHVPVLIATGASLRHLNDFLDANGVSDVNLILDEADAMWSNAVEWVGTDAVRTWRDLESSVTEREAQLYRLLSVPPLNRDATGGRLLSRVRTLQQYSATHLATVAWHLMWRLPCLAHVADTDLMLQRGYCTFRDLRPFELDGARVFLDPATQTPGGKYNVDHATVRAYFAAFRDDVRRGRLMMVALSPFHTARDVNSQTIAAKALRRVPDAFVLVASASGVQLRYRDVDERRKRVEVMSSLTTGRRMDVPEALDYADAKFGLARPGIVVGMNILTRCLSARSDKRGLTHILAAPTSGRNTADTDQMLSRGNGKLAELHAQYGFDGVSVLCTEEDYKLVTNLYDMTLAMVRRAATGNLEDVTAFMDGQYDRRYAPVLASRRPHGRPKMKIDETVVRRLRLQPAAGAAATDDEADDEEADDEANGGDEVGGDDEEEAAFTDDGDGAGDGDEVVTDDEAEEAGAARASAELDRLQARWARDPQAIELRLLRVVARWSGVTIVELYEKALEARPTIVTDDAAYQAMSALRRARLVSSSAEPTVRLLQAGAAALEAVAAQSVRVPFDVPTSGRRNYQLMRARILVELRNAIATGVSVRSVRQLSDMCGKMDFGHQNVLRLMRVDGLISAANVLPISITAAGLRACASVQP